MIRRLSKVATLLILLPHHVGAQSLSADSGTTAQRPAVVHDNAARQLVAELPEVWRTYDDMSSMSVAERKNTYRALSSSMKAAVWTHHFLTMLVQHPEFTSEQVSLIIEYLSLLTPEFFDVESFTPEWWTRVDAPLQELGKRTKAIFDPKLARTLFADLAGQSSERPLPSAHEPTTSSEQAQGIKRKLTPNTPYCECSTISDFCLSGYKCVQGGCYFTSQGCGLLWDYSCIGLCIKQDDGGG